MLMISIVEVISSVVVSVCFAAMLELLFDIADKFLAVPIVVLMELPNNVRAVVLAIAVPAKNIVVLIVVLLVVLLVVARRFVLLFVLLVVLLIILFRAVAALVFVLLVDLLVAALVEIVVFV